MRVALYGRTIHEFDVCRIRDLILEITASDYGLTIYKPLYDSLCPVMDLCAEISSFDSPDSLRNSADILLSIGGDGTLLDSLSVLRDSGMPVLGVNTGHLGFLTGVNRESIKEVMRLLAEKRYHVEPRSLIRVTSEIPLFENQNYGLNECCIHSGSTKKEIISIHLFVDEVFIATCSADGLLVATPTGSTAYSLSCGGPILQPNASCFVIMPINPHTLTFRPIVVPDNSVIRLCVEDPVRGVVVSLDAKQHVLDTPLDLTLSKENFSVNLVRLENQNFYSAIRNKLMWGKNLRGESF